MPISIYEKALEFKKNYPGTVAWRIKKHSEVVERYLNFDEKVLFVFVGQRNDDRFDFFDSCVIALTSRRIIIGIKRVLFGYKVISITPDMFNDLTVTSRLFFGMIDIDTIKEEVFISKISKKALNKIESEISGYMLREKRKYKERETTKDA